jgi:hypothetical protein
MPLYYGTIGHIEGIAGSPIAPFDTMFNKNLMPLELFCD